MSILRTILFSLLCLASAGSARAHDDPLQTFSSCVGRLSATMEHQWLLSDPMSDRTEAQRAAMLSLVEAIMPAGDGRHVLAWRIAAKRAHAVLLTRATFNDDAADAAWALTRAEAELAACTRLLLS
ncbi:MAG: hypothetical protein AAGA06_11385 [Pseudomonadota bacterium]